MQLKPAHHIHPTTLVLAALLKAAIEQCCHIWIAEHAVLLGQFASTDAAYVLNDKVPTGDVANPYLHYGEAASIKVNLHDVQLVSALLILYDRVGRLPSMRADRMDPVTVEDLRTVLTKERVLDALIPISQLRAMKRANNAENALLAGCGASEASTVSV